MRYDTQQDYEGRPRMDAEDAPVEATEAPPRTTEVPPESSDVEDMEPADRVEPVDTPAEPELVEPESAEPELVEPEPAAPEPAAVPAAPVAEDSGALWPSDVVHDLQQRWREVQWRFVDDPRAAAEEARALVTEALDRFSASVTSRKGELDGWRDTGGAEGGDTERMRMVVRRYRDLLDRLLGV